MKVRFTLLLFFLLIHRFVFCQQITFQKIYPDSASKFMYQVHQTSDGGYFCGNDLGRVLKIDSLGNLQWMKTIISPPTYIEDGYWEIAKESDGGFYLTGRMRLVRLDSNYNIQWYKEIFYDSTSYSFGIQSLQKTMNNGLIFVKFGGVRNLDNGLVKMDTSGNVLWAKHYVLPTAPYLSFTMESVALAPDGGFVATGEMMTAPNPFNNFHLIILKTDSLGNSQWCKRVYLPTGSTYFYNHITPTADGNFVISGSRNAQRYLVKIDQSGNILWMKSYVTGINSVARWAEELPDKSLIVVGDLVDGDSVSFGQTCFLMKTDSVGNLIWARRLGGFAEVWSGCVKPTTDGGFVIGARRPGPIEFTMSIIKTDSLGFTGGCLDATPVVTVASHTDSVENMVVIDSAIVVTTAPLTYTVTNIGSVITLCSSTGLADYIPDKFNISIAPNPAHNFINITSSTFINPATFFISDITGRILQMEKLPASSTNTQIDVSHLQTGLYFYSVAEVGNTKNIYSGRFVKI